MEILLRLQFKLKMNMVTTLDLSDYSYDGYTSSYKAYAVEQTTDGFVLAIKSEYGYEGSIETSWTIYDVSSSGVLDYSSYRNSVTNVKLSSMKTLILTEQLFE